MRKRNVSEELNPKAMKCMDIKQLALYLNIGTATARKLGEDAEAVIRIGKRVLFNRSLIDDYVDSISE